MQGNEIRNRKSKEQEAAEWKRTKDKILEFRYIINDLIAGNVGRATQRARALKEYILYGDTRKVAVVGVETEPSYRLVYKDGRYASMVLVDIAWMEDGCIVTNQSAKAQLAELGYTIAKGH